jgi:ATP-dependent RNA helicase SUPV3L1/SUV3
LTLWSLKQAGANGLTLDAMPEPPRAGLTSFVPDPALPEVFYRAYGYHLCGPRAVRIDILERLADIIRPLLAWRASADNPTMPPKGATGSGGFTATPEMMSLLGCSPEELSGVLKALGFRVERRPIQAPTPAAAPEVEATTPPPPAEQAVVAAPVEAPSEGSPAAADAQADAPQASPQSTEPAFEEIWRPRRHARGEPRKEGPERVHHRRPHQGARDKAAQAPAAAPGTNGHGERSSRPQGPRPERKGDRGKPPAEHGREPHQRRAKGLDKRRHDDRRKPEVHTAAPPRRGAVEADSPFAALGALREELAKRSKESSST